MEHKIKHIFEKKENCKHQIVLGETRASLNDAKSFKGINRDLSTSTCHWQPLKTVA